MKTSTGPVCATQHKFVKALVVGTITLRMNRRLDTRINAPITGRHVLPQGQAPVFPPRLGLPLGHPRNQQQALAASLRARSAESWGMQPQTKITIGEIALLLIIAAEVVIFFGYTDPGRRLLSSVGLAS
jgi:hypothetical protein